MVWSVWCQKGDHICNIRFQRKTGVLVLYLSLFSITLIGHCWCIWNCCLLRAVFLLSAGDKRGYAVEYGVTKSPWSFRALRSREILLWPIGCSSVREGGILLHVLRGLWEQYWYWLAWAKARSDLAWPADQLYQIVEGLLCGQIFADTAWTSLFVTCSEYLAAVSMCSTCVC